MDELLSYLKDKYFNQSGKSKIQDGISRQRVKNEIISVCEKYLVNAGDEFTFEVSEKDLEYALSVIDEEPIHSRYNIVQVGSSLFCASLKEINVEDIFH